MFKEFWAWSVKWGKIGARTCPAKPEIFLSTKRDDFSAPSQEPIFTKVGHVNPCLLETHKKEYLKIVLFRGHFPPKTTQNWRGKIGKYLTLTNLEPRRCTACREVLFTQHCGPAACEFPSFVHFCATFVFGTTGHQICNFRIVPIFPFIKRLKVSYWSTAHAVTLRLFTRCSVRQIGCVLLVEFSWDVWWGSWDPKFSHILAYGKCVCVCVYRPRRVRSGPTTA